VQESVFSLIPEERIRDVLENLQSLTDLAIQLIDRHGNLLMSFGEQTGYCVRLKKRVFKRDDCFLLQMKIGEQAQAIGGAYIFSCHANLNHIAFPLINQGELIGSVILGPFLMDKPDSTLVSDIAERYQLPSTLCLELYDELSDLIVIEPPRVNNLKKLLDHLLSALMPGERAMLLQAQQKLYQQSKINETIQVYKEQSFSSDLQFLFYREKVLLTKVRTGNLEEVRALLNELIGYVLFSEGGKIESVRMRAIELTTLLSRVAMEGGARADSIYKLNNKFMSLLYYEQDLDELCMALQEIVESFMSAMFYEKDKGNLHIRKALSFMADNYNQNLKLSDVAEYVGLSPSYFSTLFREVVGISFRKHLNRIRVEESKRLLLSTQYSLADIAIAMGFPDQSYYCKVFKKIVGLTPGKFRV
jgi:two-component system response regulator YesN